MGPVRLELVTSTPYRSGVVWLRYRPAGDRLPCLGPHLAHQPSSGLTNGSHLGATVESDARQGGLERRRGVVIVAVVATTLAGIGRRCVPAKDERHRSGHRACRSAGDRPGRARTARLGTGRDSSWVLPAPALFVPGPVIGALSADDGHATPAAGPGPWSRRPRWTRSGREWHRRNTASNCCPGQRRGLTTMWGDYRPRARGRGRCGIRPSRTMEIARTCCATTSRWPGSSWGERGTSMRAGMSIHVLDLGLPSAIASMPRERPDGTPSMLIDVEYSEEPTDCSARVAATISSWNRRTKESSRAAAVALRLAVGWREGVGG